VTFLVAMVVSCLLVMGYREWPQGLGFVTGGWHGSQLDCGRPDLNCWKCTCNECVRSHLQLSVAWRAGA